MLQLSRRLVPYFKPAASFLHSSPHPDRRSWFSHTPPRPPTEKSNNLQNPHCCSETNAPPATRYLPFRQSIPCFAARPPSPRRVVPDLSHRQKTAPKTALR